MARDRKPILEIRLSCRYGQEQTANKRDKIQLYCQVEIKLPTYIPTFQAIGPEERKESAENKYFRVDGLEEEWDGFCHYQFQGELCLAPVPVNPLITGAGNSLVSFWSWMLPICNMYRYCQYFGKYVINAFYAALRILSLGFLQNIFMEWYF